MIFGSNGREGGGGPPPKPGAAQPTPEERAAQAQGRVQSAYAKYPDLAQRALQSYGYGGTGNDLSSDPDHGNAEQQFATDLFMRCETVVIVGWHSAVAPTYEYEFNAGNASHPPVHSAELDFVFGYLRDQASDPVLRRLSEQMQEYWTNFAKKGDPNGPGLPQWPQFQKTDGGYMAFSNAGPVRKAELRKKACGIYTEKLSRDIDARQ